jgi:hypothetical protein
MFRFHESHKSEKDIWLSVDLWKSITEDGVESVSCRNTVNTEVVNAIMETSLEYRMDANLIIQNNDAE